MIEVKICGLTSPADIAAAAESGADYAGVHLSPSSPRCVARDVADALAAQADSLGMRAVAVLADPTDGELESLSGHLDFGFLQLNGSETPERAARAAAVTGLRVIKALDAATPELVARRNDYEAAHAFVLNPRGEWALLRRARIARPWFLAGGLTADNVAEAVQASGALAVEATSGLEAPGGAKDPALMRAFVEAAQSLG